MSKTKTKRPGVPCPLCGCQFSTVARTLPRGGVLVRLRRCEGCNLKFTTRETTAKSDTGVTALATAVTSLAKQLESSPLLRKSGQ